MRDEESGHPRLVHSEAHAVACHPRLCYFEERAADPEAIADAHLVIGQAVDREIFAKLAEPKIVAAEVSLPVAIGVRLVHHHRPALSSVSGEIPLPVAIDVQPPHYPPAAADVMFVPNWTEHHEPGGVNWTTRKPLLKGNSAPSLHPSFP